MKDPAWSRSADFLERLRAEKQRKEAPETQMINLPNLTNTTHHDVVQSGDTDESRQAWIYALKSRPCVRCGRSFSPRKMQFHHRDPAEKAFTIGVGRGRPLSALLVEIAKCDRVCRWCHVEIHRAAPSTEDTGPRENQ